jgi:xanthine/uracil/vitamin C permease (AzgA family)
MKKQTISSDSSVQKKSFAVFIKDIEKLKTTPVSEIFAGIATGVLVLFAILGATSLIAGTIGQSTAFFYTLSALALILSGLITIVASLYTRLPIVFTLSLGINAILVSSVISQFNLDWSVALGLLLIESILFALLVLSPFPKKFMELMPKFFNFAWPACLGGILVSLAMLSGKLISFRGNADIALMNFRSPEVFLFFAATVASFLLIRFKKRGFYVTIPILLAFLVMIIPTVSGQNMNKGIIIAGAFFIGWLLLYSILYDAKKKSALTISMVLLIIGLALSIHFSDKIADAIIPAPFFWFGEAGVFYWPSLAYLKEIIGYPLLTIGKVFAQLNQLWAILLSILMVHFISTWAMLACIKNRINETMHGSASENAAHKRIFAMESVSSLLASHLCLGGGTLSFGSVIANITGSKTSFSTMITGLFLLLSVVFLPFAHRYFNLYTVSPLLLALGVLLIYRSFKKWLENREELFPILAVFITGILTWNLYLSFFFGLLAFVLERLTAGKYKEINPWVWTSLIVLFIFAFLFTPISFVHFLNY